MDFGLIVPPSIDHDEDNDNDNDVNKELERAKAMKWHSDKVETSLPKNKAKKKQLHKSNVPTPKTRTVIALKCMDCNGTEKLLGELVNGEMSAFRSISS